MSRRKWTGEEKFQIVMAVLKGQGVAKLCNEYGITQGQYCRWRDVLLEDGKSCLSVAVSTKKKNA
ncbi:MAG: transposase [Lentisphaerae bacterium]|nr:transposase [bacterium]MCP4099979.1 transposase [Lentisphaerota bacterium]